MDVGANQGERVGAEVPEAVELGAGSEPPCG